MVKIFHDRIEVLVESTLLVEEQKKSYKTFVAIARWLNSSHATPSPEMQLINCRLMESYIDAKIYQKEKYAVLTIQSLDPINERDRFLKALAFFVKAYPPKHQQTEEDVDNLYLIAELMESFTKLSSK